MKFDVGNRDVDLFKIQPGSDGVLELNVDSYSIPANATPVNTVLRLFDGHDTVLATVDDVTGPDPLLRISVPKNRIYYVGVSGYPNTDYDPIVGGSTGTSTGDYRGMGVS